MFDEVLLSREGDQGPCDAAAMADARATVEWLETPKGKRAIRDVIAPALMRSLAQPRSDTLTRRPRARP